MKLSEYIFKILTQAREDLTNFKWKKNKGSEKSRSAYKGSSHTHRQEQKGGPNHQSYWGRKGGVENLSLTSSRYHRTDFSAGRTAGNLKKSSQQENRRIRQSKYTIFPNP